MPLVRSRSCPLAASRSVIHWLNFSGSTGRETSKETLFTSLSWSCSSSPDRNSGSRSRMRSRLKLSRPITSAMGTSDFVARITWA